MLKAIGIPVEVLMRNDPEEIEAYSVVEMTDEEIAERQAVEAAALAYRPARLASFLAAYRRKRVDAGFDFNGFRILTDTQSMATLTALRVLAKEDSSYSVNWKTPSGFTALSASAIIAIADAARSYVQSCYDAEAAVLGQIEGLSVTSETQVEQAFNLSMA